MRQFTQTVFLGVIILFNCSAQVVITNNHGPSNSHHGPSNSHSFPSDPAHESLEPLQNVTSKSMSVDEWLFSEDLFPGHVIPQNLHHNEAIKLFSNLLEDTDLVSNAYNRFRVQFSKEKPEDELDHDDGAKLEKKLFNFRENLHSIFHHNLKADSGQFRFQLGVNFFADMSREEMSHFLGATIDKKLPIHPKNSEEPHNPFAPPHYYPPSITPPINTSPFPLSFDLRDEKFVSPVKNQKKCGSCVFFCHGALMESLYAAKNSGKIINVSEQMMLDCANKNYGYENNNGCDGNIMEDTGRFLMEHGVTHEHFYEYQAKQENCSKEGKSIVAKLSDYWQVEPTPEAFKNVLVNFKSPIAVAYFVYPQFMFYRTGIFDWCMPPNGATGGHAVLIVGYGRIFDQEYWLVKNSWGRGWGEMGYFKYVMGSNFCQFERWGFTGTLA